VAYKVKDVKVGQEYLIEEPWDVGGHPRRIRPAVRAPGKRRSPENKVTMRQEMTPRVMWKGSNRPERISQRQKRIEKVRMRGNISRVAPRDRAAPDAEALCAGRRGVSICAWTFKDLLLYRDLLRKATSVRCRCPEQVAEKQRSEPGIDVHNSPQMIRRQGA
jgi:hypothetical protein